MQVLTDDIQNKEEIIVQFKHRSEQIKLKQKESLRAIVMGAR